jgi:Fur family ferric uptake transcriptional regulator
MAGEEIGPRTPEQIFDTIRTSGGRVTVSLRTLVDVLIEDEERHLTADELIAEVDLRAPGIAASTTYRLLQRLEELDVVEHIHTGSAAAMYQLRHHGHAHLVCHECGSITDIPEETFATLAATLDRTYRFAIEPRHAALLGRCSNCTPERGS